VPDPDTSRSSGEVPLRRRIIDDGLRPEPARLELLTAAQEAEAVELFAGLFAAAATRRATQARLKEAA
jgi:hypothetical protein